MVNETLTEKKTTKINNKDIEINSIKVMPSKHASFNGCRLDFVRRGICRTLSNILDEGVFFCENSSLSIYTPTPQNGQTLKQFVGFYRQIV